MKRLALLAFAILLIADISIAQGKLTKEERRALKKEAIEEKYDSVFSTLNSRSFVLESNTIADRYGRQIFVNPSTNFFLVEDSIAVIQLAVNNGFGYNGLGGITLEGRLTNFEIQRDQSSSKPLYIQARVFGTALGTIDLFTTINSAGRATTRFSSQYGHRLSLNGDLVKLEETLPFVGMRTF